MSLTTTEMALSPVYRHAQRTLGAWLEQRSAAARRGAFGARMALAALDPVERHRCARWVAWVCLAARSQGAPDYAERLSYLDTAFHQSVRLALDALPHMPWAAGKTRARRMRA